MKRPNYADFHKRQVTHEEDLVAAKRLVENASVRAAETLANAEITTRSGRISRRHSARFGDED